MGDSAQVICVNSENSLWRVGRRRLPLDGLFNPTGNLIQTRRRRGGSGAGYREAKVTCQGRNYLKDIAPAVNPDQIIFAVGVFRTFLAGKRMVPAKAFIKNVLDPWFAVPTRTFRTTQCYCDSARG